MSWSGPVPGAASHPPLQHANGHVKKKGNPIITRYPPPPGYRGPAQPHNPFRAQQYFGHSPTAFSGPGYQTPAHNHVYHPQPFPQPPYTQSPTSYWHQQSPLHQRPPQTYPPPTAFRSHSSFPAAGSSASYHQHNYNQAPSRPPNSISADRIANYVQSPSQGGAPSFGPPVNVTQYSSFPMPGLSQSSNPSTVASATEKSQLFLGWDDWDFDFDGAIWPKNNEPVDPSLSLGVIIWHPAKQVTRALPATFAEAEEQALMPATERLGNGESVSMYFTTENSHEAFLDVRQTDDWDLIKADPIFVEFPDAAANARNLVSLELCISQAERPDVSNMETARDDDEEMPDATYSVMDHLERALSCADGSSDPIFGKRDSLHADTRSQEDTLAALGVTGVPKPPSLRPEVYNHTMSESGPYDSTESNARYQALENSYDHNLSSSRPPLIDFARDNASRTGFDFSRTNSALETSNIDHPTLQRSYSSSYRKRSFEDAEPDDSNATPQDDHTKRKRRSQIDTVYRFDHQILIFLGC